MDNTSQSNNKPDYSFITDQRSPDLGNRRNNKKIAFVIVLMILGFVVFVANSLLGSRSNIASNDDAAPASEQSAQEIATQFISFIEKDEADKAYNLYNSRAKPAKTQFDKVQGLQYKEQLDLTSCAISDSVVDYHNYKKVPVTCALKEEPEESITYVFYVVESEGKVSIEKYLIRLDSELI